MRIHGTTRARSWRIALTMTVTAALAAALAACSSSGGGGTPTTKQHTATASAAAAPVSSNSAPSSSAPSSSAASSPASALTGTWRGQYGGAYQGTFVLHWRQSGTSLNGDIHISNPAGTLSIHGSVTAGSIRFGTVGSYAITYSGSVSGSSMSGSYTVRGSGNSGGPWSASKA